MEEDTANHDSQSAYLNPVVIVPVKEITTDENCSGHDYYQGSQILLEGIFHCYIFICSYSELQSNCFLLEIGNNSPFFLEHGYRDIKNERYRVDMKKK